jgi:PAS domain S-box-containing protein
MFRNLQAWLLGRLDSLLTPEQRRLPPAELSRLRVVVGAAVLNLALAMLNMFGPEAPIHGTLFRVAGIFFSAGYLSTLLLVRRGGALRWPALILCSTLAAGLLFSIHLIATPQVANHAAIMLVPALAVYLLGPRLGLIFAGVMALNAMVVFPLSQAGGGSDRPLFKNEEETMMALFAGVSVLGGWILSWLHSAAHEAANAALRASEGRLVSLIESTDDLVCSFDMEGRLITANQAVRRLLSGRDTGAPPRSESLFNLLLPQRQTLWKEQLAHALAGRPRRFEASASLGGKPRLLDLSLNPILGAWGQPVGVTLFGRDITERKEAEIRLAELHRSLLEVSRQAGKAEIATGVLHNVGNTLNSINVSVGRVAEQARGLRLSGVEGIARLLNEHAADPVLFFTQDPRGRQLPRYAQVLSEQLAQERAALVTEVDVLREGVEHIRAVVSMQQQHARSVGMLEEVSVPQLIDDALRLQGASFEQLGIQVRTEYATVPSVLVDRHKLLQILINLLSNARHALVESGRPDKQLSIRVGLASERRLRIEVADNGAGISPEHLPRLFSQGFTTKEAGHGFGLHISALAAQELQGSLTGVSPGKGQGATFTIELPAQPEQARA